jgi:hypothetical protein
MSVNLRPIRSSINNLESQRRQYGLVERARQLGWDEVEIVDDDLGRSGGGTVRPGFERLLAAICEERVGAVVSLEASRLARNGRDWHTLLEFCGLVGTLINGCIGNNRKNNSECWIWNCGRRDTRRVWPSAGMPHAILTIVLSPHS